MGPIREIAYDRLISVAPESVRPISVADFLTAMNVIKGSVSASSLVAYKEWNDTFGALG